jgi:hypothetical protein
MLGKVTDAVTAITRTQKHHSQIVTRHSELLEKILGAQHNYGYSLNAIDGRLTLIEKHTGLQRRKTILSQKKCHPPGHRAAALVAFRKVS